MVKTGSGDVFFFQQIKNARDILYVSFIDSKAQPHLNTCFLAIINGLQCFFIGTGNAPELVMGGLKSVQADPYIGEPHRFELFCFLFGDQGAVG